MNTTTTNNDAPFFSIRSDSDSDSDSDFSDINFSQEDPINFAADFVEFHSEFTTDDSEFDSDAVSLPDFDTNIEFTVSETTPDDFSEELGLGFHDQIPTNDEFQWEEVDEVDEVDERQGLTSMIDRIEEISVSSDEIERNLDWEILWAGNFVDRNFDSEYETVFGQVDSGINTVPRPAAKSFLDHLPSVVLTKGEVCAICKDDILVDEKVMRLPCCHNYHGDCIVPWLSIRNTCPVCRFVLPTDDVDSGQGGVAMLDDVQA